MQSMSPAEGLSRAQSALIFSIDPASDKPLLLAPMTASVKNGSRGAAAGCLLCPVCVEKVLFR